MAPSDGLTSPIPDSGPDTEDRGRRASDTGPGAGPGLYWALAGGLVALAAILGGLQPPPPARSQLILLVVEAGATTLALLLGALALVRYYSRRRRTYLFIGTGFVATGFLDAVHLAASPAWGLAGSAPGTQGPLEWSWLLSRGFLGVYLYVSLQASRGTLSRVPRLERERAVYLSGVAATLAALVVATAVPPPSVQGPGFLPAPLELIPALFFGLTVAGYLRRGNWRRDVFERWFIAGLIVSALLHVLFTARSAAAADVLFLAGHALQPAGYLAILVGVLQGVQSTFRREERALEAIQEVNEALAREVAVRREAEAVLQRSEERLQNFLETAHDLIQSTAPGGEFLYVNPAWERTLGYGRGELQGVRLQDVIHPARRDAFMDRYREVLARGGAPRLEVEFLTRDGRRVTCSGSATRLVVGGEAVAVQAIFRDVSEQRRTERELAASRASLGAVVESTGDSIWSVDTQMRLVTFNTAFALALEARSGLEAHPGDLPEDLFDAGDAAWHRALYERALQGERFSVLREETVAGHTRMFEIFCHPITGEEGIAGAVMFGKDVTRRVRAEEALRMAKEEAEGANRAKTQFLANMSHELRTPLNSVIGFANVLLKNKRGTLGEQELNFLDRIAANGRHLLSLINEVLDLAKVEAGRMELEIEELDLGDLVRETVQQLEGQAHDRQVDLAWSVPDGLPPVETDRAKLKQVLINLVGNAVKFSPGGRVTVSVLAAPDGSPAAVAVQDTGIGIPADRLEAIFEAFQQADGSTSREYGGTGLGLTISRSMCQLMGYELEVASEVGKGSTFTVRMEGAARAARAQGEDWRHPGDDGPASLALEAEGGRAPAGTHEFKVLVVDDESDSRVLLAHYLRDFGCQVLSAAGAAEGIEVARREQPDLVTLDLRMPGMSGWEALQRLKDDPETRDIPVVVVSIVAQENRGRLLGAVDLLSKPVEREDLLRVLWRNLVRRRGGRVLLVEPDPETRSRLERFLAEAGMEVATAPNGRAALRLVEEDAPDLILTELSMPVMDGIAFLTRLRQNPYYAGLPALVLTNRELTRAEAVTLEEKASAVIPKGEAMESGLRETLGRILPMKPRGEGSEPAG